MIIRNVGLSGTVEAAAKVGSRIVSNLSYTDDTSLLAEAPTDPKRLLKAGLAINLKKAKIMSTADPQEFDLDVEKAEIVDRFVLLGSLFAP